MNSIHSIKKNNVKAVLFALSLLLYSFICNAQYFGRNKVNYSQIDFEVLQTPHFEIYHYLNNKPARNRIAQQTEQWYKMHQAIFRDTFKTLNPFILYNSHADFQQTRTIDGMIGVGTGGVTEALKNRVILPFMESNAQTDHVLGHELVHAFQYHLVKESDSLSLTSLRNLPLWMVEGLAEYMSIGYIDAHTAIWLRSAVLNNKLPSVKDLTNRPDEYFPYRWGQAFWAYVTGIYGDEIIKPLFASTARHGYEDAFKRVLGLDHKAFSNKWKESLRNTYAPFQKYYSVTPLGKNLINKKNAGELNIVPSLSPDGKMIAFWTEKSLFSLDLYVAEAATGRIIKKITSNSFSSHIDEYSSFESSVAWSPESKQLAFVAFSKGSNRLIIANINGKKEETIEIPGLPGFSNPAWSPDGKNIVVTGLVNGQSDLYKYNLITRSVKQLTNDHYADLQPSFSADGKWIAFSTDRLSVGSKYVQHHYSHNIALLNTATNNVTVLEFFNGANNLNPIFASDNNSIYFLSDRDGFRNLYSYQVDTKQISQLTNLFTGITGITSYAPAISTSRQTKQVVYNYYSRDEYYIQSANSDEFTKTSVNSENVNMQAAMLPPMERLAGSTVHQNIYNTPYELVAENALISKPYRSKFELDYVGNTGVGVSTGRFGTGVAGGVNGIFSDMLGNHQLYGALALNGELYDIGGQFAYINQKKRFIWGSSISHLPYRSGYQFAKYDNLVINSDTVQVINYSTDILRTFEDQVSLFASYPFSQIGRIEAGASFAKYYYRLDRYTDYYDESGFHVASEKNKLAAPEGFNFSQGYVALVGDNSHAGVASPLTGHRYRLEVSKYFGVVNLQTALADYRKYFRFAPFTLATRNMYNARFGRDADNGKLPPLFLGYPTLVRGYDALDFATESNRTNLSINDLLGSKIFVTNAELRFPFTGPERLSAIKSRFLFSELSLFTDGGIAWGSNQTPGSKESGLVPVNSRFIMSSGVSLRINLFGYLVIEPFYAIPWQNGGLKNASFGLNFSPGF